MRHVCPSIIKIVPVVNYSHVTTCQISAIETVPTINTVKRKNYQSHTNNSHTLKVAKPTISSPASANTGLSPSISHDPNPLISAEARFFYHFLVGRVEVTALLDSGAMINCISEEVMTYIMKDDPTIIVSVNDLPSLGTAAKNGTLKAVGRVQLDCLMGNIVRPVNFAICAGLSQSIILGRPFYKQHVTSTNEKPPVLVFNDREMAYLTTQPDRYKGEVTTVTDVIIPPGRTKIIVAKINQPIVMGTLGLVTPLISLCG